MICEDFLDHFEHQVEVEVLPRCVRPLALPIFPAHFLPVAQEKIPYFQLMPVITHSYRCKSKDVSRTERKA